MFRIADQAAISRTRTPGSVRASGSTGSCGSNRDRDKNLQFSFVATSTPLSDCLNTVGGKSKFLFFVVMLDVPSLDIRITSHASSTRSSSKRFAEIFTGGAAEPSPITCEEILTTPDILGIKKNGKVDWKRQRFLHCLSLGATIKVRFLWNTDLEFDFLKQGSIEEATH
ncbi:unnamed protein product [Enterobius vermicularis]|uniref:Uncharacterized protein n=1 Tax=Enterobius vermicularis TaxID=51028 RepID=A0A0N4UV88_ENTVE|nr:unnamed protein product [Enterobius vermicularis]